MAIGKTNSTFGKEIEMQQKTVNITTNGTTNVTPDIDKVLSKVTVNVNVPTYQVGSALTLITKSGLTPGSHAWYSFDINLNYTPNTIHSVSLFGDRYTKNASITYISSGQVLNTSDNPNAPIVQFLNTAQNFTITIRCYNDSNMGIAGAPIPAFNVGII